ncbi:MAG: DNA mismatch repair protein MutL [Firmicutes bacterium]|nr:DNA mismatch repair protein MutL [Bacillota bacterium]HOB34551.1 GlmL-related ornithine degradation protein [Bacillota bacterium]HPZ91066.1 GlmL-related ornithine degradation protein [Bacillota bacterium]HQE01899.1 GlmL-related ornithine degradation protein [Bacillota bacterium]
MKLEIIVAEIGSTTTVVSGFTGLDSSPRLAGQGQGPTTVEEGDVRRGLNLALADLRDKLGAADLDWDHICACSSAAGGLKMTVHGLVYDMTVRAAREAALGAGAVLRHLTAGPIADSDLEKIAAIRPNIILLAGGVDYGERGIVLENAEKLASLDLPVPLIYAGNVAVQEEVRRIFRPTRYRLIVVENVYPRIDELNIEPTRRAIQAAFEEHIVDAPGMGKIRELVDGPIQPVPGAVLNAAVALYQRLGDLMVFDVGGATTDLHSVTPGSDEVNAILLNPEPLAKRTVEGDLGVYRNAGNLIALIGREELAARLGTPEPERHVVPIPAAEPEIALARELARAAVRTALERHAGRIKHVYGPGGRIKMARGKDLTRVRWIIGTGGALTRLPRPEEILVGVRGHPDPAFLGPPAEARIVIDRHYIMAAAGVLAHSHPRAAVELMLNSAGIQGESHATQTQH